MKRLLGVAALALAFTAGVATAQTTPESGTWALGFHHVDAPIGIRWWLNDKVALDAGLGVGSEESAAFDENLSRWALDLGVPILLRSFDRLNFMVRPGLMFVNEETVTDPGPPVETGDDSFMTVGVELEAEVFLTNRFSVSAAHGFAFMNTDPAVGESTTDWGTTGANFTNIGFHLYLSDTNGGTRSARR